MRQDNYRVEKQGNGILNGREGTIYHIYELSSDNHGFVHLGASCAPGFDRTPGECLTHWLSKESDDNDTTE